MVFSATGFAQSSKQVAMKKELFKLNTYYQELYSQSPKIDHIYTKIIEYKSQPELGVNEFADKDEIEGLEWFEVLQSQRDVIALSIYKDYQSKSFVTMMKDYNLQRKTLRLQLAHQEITWRQFIVQLQMILEKNQEQQKLLWEKDPTIKKEMV
jgi:hypothetical protein